MSEAFATLLEQVEWPIPADAAQLEQYVRGYNAVVTANQTLNLTRLLDPEAYWEKHLWDSLQGLKLLALPDQGTLVDVGSGAGFPGIPAAIALPGWRVTVLDATQRKVAFLRELASELQLDRVSAIAGRAETLAHASRYREQFDLATIRAVGTAAACLEYCLPFVKVGGQVLLYRGHWTEAEAISCRRAAHELGGKVSAAHAFTTPITASVRHCIVVSKVKSTPRDYPRRPGIPQQQPLA